MFVMLFGEGKSKIADMFLSHGRTLSFGISNSPNLTVSWANVISLGLMLFHVSHIDVTTRKSERNSPQ